MIAPVDGGTSQGFGENPTANLPADSWLIQTFGNYQPNGHTGVDFPVPVGTPVRAVADGTVLHSGWYSGTYDQNPYWIAPAFAGCVLVIDHGSFIGIYAHLSESPLSEGAWVTGGQVVAKSGNTGGSTGPHLHFEVLPDGWDFSNGMYGRVDPTPYISSGLAAMGGVITTTEPTQEDDLSAEFERDVRAQLASDAGKFAALDRDLRAQLQGLPSLDRDVRADLAQKGRQIAALTSTTEALAGLVGREQGLDVETIKQAVTEAIAAGLTVTVEVK
jgi:hypothetical protein